MGLKKGQTNNPKGRPKSSGDRRTSDLLGIWDGKSFCPGIRLTELVLSGELDPRDEAMVLLKMMKFKFHELRAVEHSISEETIKALTIEEYLKTLK